jgi:hypothetical protein
MSNSPSLIVVIAFAGVLIWLGAAPARAADAGDACRQLAPRYEPKAARPAGAQPVRWPGGAKLWRPVAQPCPRSGAAVGA